MLKPLKKTKLHEQISKQLIDLILTGELKAGDHLPTERELAMQLGVSRTAIREAILQMELKGYLLTRADGRTVVREVTFESILPYVSSLLSTDRHLLYDLLGVRKLLESEMAYNAARNITFDKAEHLKMLADQFSSDIQEGKTGLSADNRFHSYITELAQNSAMHLINEMCSDLLSDTRLATLRVPEHRRQTVNDHY
ncbi:MAG: GntR family transcriptional regulator, partial [Eubacteriales bacterium]|nr:GntR family transcriptional regulator [Eubacteriales bacterium]